MNITELLGVPGAPLETLDAVLEYVGRPEVRGTLGGSRLALVTDRTGERVGAGYGALLLAGSLVGAGGTGRVVPVAWSFGPAFGAAGGAALSGLLGWAVGAGVLLREAVVGAGEARALGDPDGALVARVVAASSPVEPGLYLGAGWEARLVARSAERAAAQTAG
ncbi:DUF3197 domain-containing protein [Deinococcus knuensis]|uniref:Uncharacterized protein n=1 Tax=Deinococcus knuensis TaxID=1837380 RepID=A0ABQ2SMT9_9DEIO|nr:DUF3197 domain-containing protein [Deinococcus knuensis]GGS34592.1 hypothetical protein GCM10008961_27940 [Deinococcus knuensis]